MNRCAIFATLVLSLALPAFGQAAPARSDELCKAMQQTATENGKKFLVTAPGACMAEIDNGYALLVAYKEETLHVGMTQTFLPNGDPQAFWLRLSALDNLAHVALGTKQEAVFDELNKMAKDAANEMVPLLHQGRTDVKLERHGKAQRAVLYVSGDAHGVVLLASATTHDIDKMKRERKREEELGSDGARWRQILALSLLTFAAGAKGYSNAYSQSLATQRRSVTCYTNLLGNFATTTCQ